MIDERKPIFSMRDGIVSPTFVASADIHLGHKLYNMPELEEDMQNNFVRLCDIAIVKQVQFLVICGDLYDNNIPSALSIALVKNQVSRLKEHGIEVVGIAGDHDKPINGESWRNVSDIKPVTICEHFTGFDYYDTSTGMGHVMDLLKDKREPESVYWIFLHAQFPHLFQHAEDKKKIDFAGVDLFKDFPNLQGVIAGDIHEVSEMNLYDDSGKSAYCGYCSSLGINAIDEAEYTHSVLYCDGKHLYRLPFAQKRDYIKIDFRGANIEKFTPDFYVKQYKEAANQPVFSITWDKDSEPYLKKLRPLYSVGIVRMAQAMRMKSGEIKEVSNIRAEMKTEDRIDAAVKKHCNGDSELAALVTDTLKSADPRIPLDAFKQKAFGV